MGNSIESILQDVVQEDKSILSRRREFINRMARELPEDLEDDFAPIKSAVQNCSIGDVLLAADRGGQERQREARENAFQKLMDAGMQKERAAFVVDALSSALGWGKGGPEQHAEKKPDLAQFHAGREAPVQASSSWTCACGQENSGMFCSACGRKKASISLAKTLPMEPATPAPSPVVTAGLPVKVDASPVPSAHLPATSESQASFANGGNPWETASGSDNAEKWRRYKDGMVAEYLITHGRLNRLAYFVKSIKFALWNLLFALIAGIIGAIIAPLGKLMGVIVFIFYMVGSYMLIIRRLHDLNKSGWFCLIALVPYINILFSIYVLFFKGTDGPNHYGEDPLQGGL